ncbi:MAG: parallel beta-helix domain-containing protein [Pseudomonadales bacterium]
MPRFMTFAFLTTFFLFGCEQQEKPATPPTAAKPSPQESLTSRLRNAQPDQVIEIAAGRYDLNSGLSVTADGVTVRGAGMNKTVLSFKNQNQTNAGLSIKANGFVLEDIGIEDSKAEAVKLEGGKNLVIRRVRTQWTGGSRNSNGAYGIHVSQAENVLIENSVAIGASAAGIYLAQSKNLIVRNNRAEFNVAAIQLGNSSSVDIYGNTMLKNSSGILVFTLPDVAGSSRHIRVYDNKVYANNKQNFGAGTAAAAVAVGSGIVVNASDRVEIFGNYIADNKTANVIIGSYFTAAYYSNDQVLPANFDPYPEGIFIYANKFSGGGEAPEKLDWEALREAKFGTNGSLSDIVWDGYTDPAKAINAKPPVNDAICVDNTQASIVNIDAANNYQKVDKSMRPHRCLLPKLPAIDLPGR